MMIIKLLLAGFIRTILLYRIFHWSKNKSYSHHQEFYKPFVQTLLKFQWEDWVVLRPWSSNSKITSLEAMNWLIEKQHEFLVISMLTVTAAQNSDLLLIKDVPVMTLTFQQWTSTKFHLLGESYTILMINRNALLTYPGV